MEWLGAGPGGEPEQGPEFAQNPDGHDEGFGQIPDASDASDAPDGMVAEAPVAQAPEVVQDAGFAQAPPDSAAVVAGDEAVLDGEAALGDDAPQTADAELIPEAVQVPEAVPSADEDQALAAVEGEEFAPLAAEAGPVEGGPVEAPYAVADAVQEPDAELAAPTPDVVEGPEDAHLIGTEPVPETDLPPETDPVAEAVTEQPVFPEPETAEADAPLHVAHVSAPEEPAEDAVQPLEVPVAEPAPAAPEAVPFPEAARTPARPRCPWRRCPSP